MSDRANVASSPQTQRGLMAFRTGGQRCALPLKWVREIVHMALLSHPPGLPSILQGFLNLQGEALPVLRLDRLFGLSEQSPGLYTPLVILRNPGPPLALAVDEVTGVFFVSAEGLLPVRETDLFNGCVEAEVVLGGQTVHLLSLERLLLEQERRRIAEFQAMERRRLHELGVSPS